jgi:hypothetical protein
MVEPDADANVADTFLDLPEAANLEQRGTPRLGRRAAIPNALRG